MLLAFTASRRLVLKSLTARRLLSSSSRTPPPTHSSRLLSRRAFYATTLSLGVAGIAVATPVAQSPDVERQQEDFRPPLSALIRAYIVYSICSIPPLVNAAPKLLSLCQSIPGLRQITEAVVRVTFFNQVGHGEVPLNAGETDKLLFLSMSVRRR